MPSGKLSPATIPYSLPPAVETFGLVEKQWKPIIDKYEVDLVLNGHDHTYARGHVPVREKSGDSNKMGAVYVTSVSGPKQYSLNPKQLDSYKKDGYIVDKTAEQTQFFQVITVENNSLETLHTPLLVRSTIVSLFKKTFPQGRNLCRIKSKIPLSWSGIVVAGF